MTDTMITLDKPTLEWMLGPAQPMLSMVSTGLAGLTDEEYLWEPVDGCWSVRPRSEQRTAPDDHRPEGDWGLDIEYPDPVPAPFTTIAWRLMHMTGSVYVAAAALRGRCSNDGPVDSNWPQDRAVPTTAPAAVERWEDAVNTLRGLLAEAGPEDLRRMERQYWDPDPTPVAEHVFFYGYFEVASHAAEIRLLRDLYRLRQTWR